jgi:hypothetical protein
MLVHYPLNHDGKELMLRRRRSVRLVHVCDCCGGGRCCGVRHRHAWAVATPLQPQQDVFGLCGENWMALAVCPACP